MTDSKREPVDFDGAWKHAVRWLLRPMIELMMPELYAQVDWRVEPIFLEQELPKLRGFGRRGKRVVDRLIRLTLLTQKHCDLLLHVEIQGRRQKQFASRMLGYYLFMVNEHGDREVAQLAILCDLQSDWRPSGLSKSSFGTRLEYCFHVVKLVDYEPELDHLIASGNPFALVIAAQIKATRVKRSMRERARWKEEYLVLAKGLGKSEEEVGAVMTFIDHVLLVSPALDKEIKRRQNESGKEGAMFHTGGIVGPARVQAFAEGKTEGMVTILLNLIKAKFGDVPAQTVQRVQEASSETLLQWSNNLLNRDKLEEVFLTSSK